MFDAIDQQLALSPRLNIRARNAVQRPRADKAALHRRLREIRIRCDGDERAGGDAGGRVVATAGAGGRDGSGQGAGGGEDDGWR